MLDTLKKWLKVAAVIAVIWIGVQVALVYINRLQLHNIMDGETMDARRQNYDATTLLSEIKNRARSTISVPIEDIEFTVVIPDDPLNGDYSVTAVYTDWVDLVRWHIPMDQTIVATAEPPVR